ncbi:MAG: hypothetical protein WDN76_01155 [Alphaproteobacteria bacterium]
MALGGAADATETLRLALLDAVGQDNGQSLATSIQAAFDSAKQAFNTTFEGEAIFGGERIGATPINVTSLAALAAAPSTASIFDEATRAKTADLGDGPFAVSPKASDVSTGLFDTLRQLKQMIDAAGGSLPSPLTSAQKNCAAGLRRDAGRVPADSSAGAGVKMARCSSRWIPSPMHCPRSRTRSRKSPAMRPMRIWPTWPRGFPQRRSSIRRLRRPSPRFRSFPLLDYLT